MIRKIAELEDTKITELPEVDGGYFVITDSDGIKCIYSNFDEYFKLSKGDKIEALWQADKEFNL